MQHLAKQANACNNILFGWEDWPSIQTAIRAGLVGSNTCTAVGITIIDHAPVLALCRALVKAGHDPTTPLEVWRGKTLCLRVRSIGEGAQLTVEDDRGGRPRLRRWRNRARGCGAGPPVRQIGDTAGVVNGCAR